MDAPIHPIADGRKRLGKTQDEFGRDVGVDGLTVSRWERGESLPSRRYWSKIEELTGHPIAEVIAFVKPVEAAQ